MKNTLTPVIRRLANTRRSTISQYLFAFGNVRRRTMTIECIDRPGVPLGYVLEHVTLTTKANFVHKPVPYTSLYVCKIPACCLSIDSVRLPHCDSIESERNPKALVVPERLQ